MLWARRSAALDAPSATGAARRDSEACAAAAALSASMLVAKDPAVVVGGAAAAPGVGCDDADVDPAYDGDCEDVVPWVAPPPAVAPCEDGGAAEDCG